MLRLYLPVLAVQLCVLLATLLGLYDHAFELAKDWPFSGTNEQQHKKQDSAFATITDWSRSMWNAANPFSPKRPDYDPHLWTISLEFRNSIVLFVTLMGFSKLRPRIRVWLTLALYFYLVVIEQGDAALFIAGMACAEFLVRRDEKVKQLPTTEKADAENQSIGAKAIWTFVYVIGLHLLSIPAGK
jgi:peptidoglycan/LPS O-acetylase OafA/YrhL